MHPVKFWAWLLACVVLLWLCLPWLVKWWVAYGNWVMAQ